ncbi:MAG TPA: sugar ABC transporter substrate-binding protein [Fimbriimonas sp.]|nr:sugar ABC transporter substrate-binding protein [Fimbriimonas sp.]
MTYLTHALEYATVTAMKERFPRLAILLALIVVCIVALAGCGQNSAPPTAPTPATTNLTKKPKVALVMKSLANAFFQTMEQGAKAHQAAHSGDYELIANGIENEQDVPKQVDLVKQMIAQKVDAIVLAPADSKALVPVCKEAQDAGIVVVNIDNKLDADALKEKQLSIPFVGPDNRKGAKMVGDFLAKSLKAGDEVAIIGGIPGAFNAQQRQLGFEDAMKAANAKIMTEQAADWDTSKASSIVSAILPRYPQLKAILCANDSMALGAVGALTGANKAKQVLVAGFDNIAAVQQLIKEGKVLCTADQHGDQIAVNGIEFALDILHKKATPQDKELPVDLITAQTLGSAKTP